MARIFIELAKYGFARADINLKVFSGLNRSLFLKDEPELRRKCCGIYIPHPLNKIRLLLPVNRFLFAFYSQWVKADICHYTNLDIPYVPPKTKTVITIHDLIDEIYDPRGLECPRAVERRKALDRADGIICVSEKTRTDLLKYYPDVDPSRVTVIYNGNNLQKVIPDDTDHSKPFLLYVGMRVPAYKNFNIILELMRDSSEFSGYDLICFGGGSFSTDECRLIAEYGLEKRVVQTGGPDSMLSGYYKNAYALIYPSKYEGFGIPTIEAVSVGCPVVCSNAFPMPEVNGDGVLYFSPDNKEELERQLDNLKNQDSRNQLIERGRKRAALFSWKKTCEETYAFYEQVLRMDFKQ